ncbi:hypothetical protein KAZ01_00605 [Candidatus Gracilibacteria bacterium]|nr:hypothetical protein [Candidatus Gracilibacteria bacterium]
MRLWSLHPKYLDTKGLIATWREGLLAKKVLENKTKGYKNHPQLIRFKNYKNPILAINSYLYFIFLESKKRGYSFDKIKIIHMKLNKIINVTDNQIKFELNHLLNKLEKRDIKKFNEINKITINKIDINPIFNLTKGEIESWEKI